MQKLLPFQLSLFTAILLCAPAQAAPFKGEARLVTPTAAPASFTIAGADWRCEGDRCVGAAPYRRSIDSFMRECRKVSAAVGPLAAYKSRGRAMSAGSLAACNRPEIR